MTALRLPDELTGTNLGDSFVSFARPELCVGTPARRHCGFSTSSRDDEVGSEVERGHVPQDVVAINDEHCARGAATRS